MFDRGEDGIETPLSLPGVHGGCKTRSSQAGAELSLERFREEVAGCLGSGTGLVDSNSVGGDAFLLRDLVAEKFRLGFVSDVVIIGFSMTSVGKMVGAGARVNWPEVGPNGLGSRV